MGVWKNIKLIAGNYIHPWNNMKYLLIIAIKKGIGFRSLNSFNVDPDQKFKFKEGCTSLHYSLVKST